MQKSPTLWHNNPAKSGGVAYSDPGTQYNSSTTPFSAASVGLADSGKVPEAWTLQPKTPTLFVPNAAANTKLYQFDSASHTYDSAVDTYDGVVAGQNFADREQPTQWSNL